MTTEHLQDLQRKIHVLTLAVWHEAKQPALTPHSKLFREATVIGLTKTAFRMALELGIDIEPAFKPASPDERPWKPKRKSSIITCLRTCYSAVQSLQQESLP